MEEVVDDLTTMNCNNICQITYTTSLQSVFMAGLLSGILSVVELAHFRS